MTNPTIGLWTPGPWLAERRKHCSVVLQTAAKKDGYSDRVAECPQWSPALHPQPTPDEAFANARLIAKAPDHALIGWAMCVQDATWEEWGEGKGEFCFAGLRHSTSLDEFGCPVLTDNLRALITKARDQ